LVVLGQTDLNIFDPAGALVRTVSLPFDTGVYGKLAVGTDGKLVVAGSSHLTRYNADLTPDPSFCGGAPCLSPLSGIRDVRVAKDGKIVTASLPRTVFIARQLSDGSLDTAFGYSGVVAVPGNPGWGKEDIEVDDSGRILVATSGSLPQENVNLIDANGAYLGVILPTTTFEFIRTLFCKRMESCSSPGITPLVRGYCTVITMRTRADGQNSESRRRRSGPRPSGRAARLSTPTRCLTSVQARQVT
jgi:hypothetical protein